MASFLSTRALNNLIRIGVGTAVLGSIINTTLYNGKLLQVHPDID